MISIIFWRLQPPYPLTVLRKRRAPFDICTRIFSMHHRGLWVICAIYKVIGLQKRQLRSTRTAFLSISRCKRELNVTSAVYEIQADAADGCASLELCIKYKQRQQMVLCHFSCVRNISICDRWLCVTWAAYKIQAEATDGFVSLQMCTKV